MSGSDTTITTEAADFTMTPRRSANIANQSPRLNFSPKILIGHHPSGMTPYTAMPAQQIYSREPLSPRTPRNDLPPSLEYQTSPRTPTSNRPMAGGDGAKASPSFSHRSYGTPAGVGLLMERSVRQGLVLIKEIVKGGSAEASGQVRGGCVVFMVFD